MIELAKLAVDTIIGVVGKWITAGPEERAALEKQTIESIAVMRGERKLTHESLEASEAETRRVIAEAKARILSEPAPLSPTQDEPTQPYKSCVAFHVMR
jgi:hypothetical protein